MTRHPGELASLVSDPARAPEVRPEQIPAFLCRLGTIQALLAARLTATPHVAPHVNETLLTVSAAAERLEVSRDWLYRRSRRLPFVVRMGRQLRFSAAGID